MTGSLKGRRCASGAKPVAKRRADEQKRHRRPSLWVRWHKISKPTILDRLIQQTIQQVLQPMFDPDFSTSSDGFRPFRSAHDAVKQVRKNIDSGYRYVVDIDLKKFFDNVNHDVLMSRVARKVKEKRVLKLIGRYLRAGAG